ncbi:hypothetical protein D3C80_602580 [compost metagenome]
MCAAERFRDDAVDDLEVEQILRGDAHVGGSILCTGRIVPEDRSRTFRRNHRIDRMFEHIDAVCDSNRDCTARTAFTDYDRDNRHAQLEAFCR